MRLVQSFYSLSIIFCNAQEAIVDFWIYSLIIIIIIIIIISILVHKRWATLFTRSLQIFYINLYFIIYNCTTTFIFLIKNHPLSIDLTPRLALNRWWISSSVLPRLFCRIDLRILFSLPPNLVIQAHRASKIWRNIIFIQLRIYLTQSRYNTWRLIILSSIIWRIDEIEYRLPLLSRWSTSWRIVHRRIDSWRWMRLNQSIC